MDVAGRSRPENARLPSAHRLAPNGRTRMPRPPHLGWPHAADGSGALPRCQGSSGQWPVVSGQKEGDRGWEAVRRSGGGSREWGVRSREKEAGGGIYQSSIIVHQSLGKNIGQNRPGARRRGARRVRMPAWWAQVGFRFTVYGKRRLMRLIRKHRSATSGLENRFALQYPWRDQQEEVQCR